MYIIIAHNKILSDNQDWKELHLLDACPKNGLPVGHVNRKSIDHWVYESRIFLRKLGLHF